MSGSTLAGLPTGRRGQALALGVTLILLAALWAGVVAPLLALHADRVETLAQRRALAGRMANLAETLPLLRRQASAVEASGPAPQALLEGATDAIAGATLQETVQRMAQAAGANLTSVEALPGQAAGALRRVGLRVSLAASWPVLIELLGAIDRAAPRMLVDDLSLQASLLTLRPGQSKLDIRFSVYAFRTGTEPGP